MPSPRKRIGFLPSEEVHEIIEKLCTANEFSQSKVTGLLVEEALRSRGVLNLSFDQSKIDIDDFINFSCTREKSMKSSLFVLFGTRDSFNTPRDLNASSTNKPVTFD